MLALALRVCFDAELGEPELTTCGDGETARFRLVRDCCLSGTVASVEGEVKVVDEPPNILSFARPLRGDAVGEVSASACASLRLKSGIEL